jgi:alkanesulfonate monooxygenase
MRPLEFGWYLPTHVDTTAYGLAEAQVAGSPDRLAMRLLHGLGTARLAFASRSPGPGP